MRNLSCIIITKIKCSAINLPKEKNDLHIANYKPLMKETKDTKNGDILCSQIRRINSSNVHATKIDLQI